jgi:hypothetical protein
MGRVVAGRLAGHLAGHLADHHPEGGAEEATAAVVVAAV